MSRTNARKCLVFSDRRRNPPRHTEKPKIDPPRSRKLLLAGTYLVGAGEGNRTLVFSLEVGKFPQCFQKPFRNFAAFWRIEDTTEFLFVGIAMSPMHVLEAATSLHPLRSCYLAARGVTIAFTHPEFGSGKINAPAIGI